MGAWETGIAESLYGKLTLSGGDKKDWAWTGLSPESGVTAQGHPACNADRSIALALKVHLSFPSFSVASSSNKLLPKEI